MKKLSVRLLILFMILICFSITAFADLSKQSTGSDIDKKYTVAPKGDYFEVKADVTNINEARIKVVFIDSCAGVNNLSSRIKHFLAMTPDGKELAVEKINNEFLINTAGQNEITLSYQIDPNTVKHDHHLVTLTSTYLHIPGDNFIIQVYDEKDNQINSNDIFKIKLTGLPKGWEALHTYPLSEAGYITVDNYHEALIHAGAYEKFPILIGGCEFMIAADKALEFDIKPFIGDIKAILQYHYQTFGKVTSSKILIVINQRRIYIPWMISSGGQVKNYNIINEFNGINKYNQGLFKIQILGHLVHESFHLWMCREFNVTDNWSWFWEGFADYQKYRVLKNLGIISPGEFEKSIRDISYAGYYGSQYKDELSLVEISKEKGDFSKYSRLLYDKGAVVAYLFDKELQKQNSNVDKFLGEFYREYGIPKKPLGTVELIKVMDKALGDSTFTRKYILGTTPLPFKTLAWFKYYASVRNYLPPVPLPWSIVIPMIVIILIPFLLWLILKGIKAIVKLAGKTC